MKYHDRASYCVEWRKRREKARNHALKTEANEMLHAIKILLESAKTIYFYTMTKERDFR